MGRSDADEDLAALLHQGYRYAFALTHNAAAAEDLLQDAWVAVLQAKGPHNRAYLFSAIRSRYINLGKRNRLVPMVPLTDEHSAETRSDCDDLVRLRDADGLLAELRPVEREALFLSVVEGYTAAEIAAHTGAPRGTVLSLIHRAKNKLRALALAAEEVKHGQS